MSAEPIRIFVDADACPVKDEVYKVAARYGLKTFVVSNSFMMVPRSAMIEQVVVDAGPDVADDWIAERIAPGDIAVTNDIAIAQRALMEQLRSTGEITGGPKPFDRNDRSRFLQALDEAVQREKRKRR